MGRRGGGGRRFSDGAAKGKGREGNWRSEGMAWAALRPSCSGVGECYLGIFGPERKEKNGNSVQYKHSDFFLLKKNWYSGKLRTSKIVYSVHATVLWFLSPQIKMKFKLAPQISLCVCTEVSASFVRQGLLDS
jgi:hypothetical protein